jgi:hypothetical protein
MPNVDVPAADLGLPLIHFDYVSREALIAAVAAAEPTIRRRFRILVGQEIEQLLALLDEIDGDPDLEPSLGRIPFDDVELIDAEGDGDPDLEPTFAATVAFNQDLAWSGPTFHDELEEACEDEGAQCDDEGNDSGDREPDLAGGNSIYCNILDGEANGPAFDGPDPWQADRFEPSHPKWGDPWRA